MGALNIPSAADIERLTRRLRSVSQRLESIEDGVDRLDRRLAGLKPGGARRLDEQLGAIEAQLARLPGRSPARGAGGQAPASPREQERLEVDEGAGQKGPQAAAPRSPLPPRRRARTACRGATAAQPLRAERGERRLAKLAARRRRARRRRCGSRAATRWETDSRQPAATPRKRASGQQGRRLHLDRERARDRPRPRAIRVGVVEEVGGGDQHRRASRDAAASAAVSCGSASTRSPPPSARLAPSRAQRGAGDQRVAERRSRRPARRTCRRAPAGARRAASAPRSRSRRSGRPCRCSGSSAARRQLAAPA